MRNAIYSVITSIGLAVPLVADETYKFKVSVATSFEALGKVSASTQQNRWNAASKEERQSMKTDKVVLFEGLEGARWKATFASCSKTIAECEVRVSAQGVAGARRDQDPFPIEGRRYDLGFSVNADGSFTVRCLRPSCRLGYEKNGKRGELSLLFDQSGKLPAAPEVEVVIPATELHPSTSSVGSSKNVVKRRPPVKSAQPASPVAASSASPATADEGYRFKVSVTTMFDALEKHNPELLNSFLANPSEAVRLRVKTQKVMLFEKLHGTHWKWTYSNCSKEITDCEFRVNKRGGGGVRRESDPLAAGGRPYDLGFSVNADGSFTLRCLRASCWIRFKKDREEGELSLLFLESGNILAESEIDAVFPVLSDRHAGWPSVSP